MTHKKIRFEDIFTFNEGAWDMSCDFEASQKKLDEALTTYRAQVLEEAQTAIFNAEPATKIRIPSYITGKIATWELVNVEDIEHPKKPLPKYNALAD